MISKERYSPPCCSRTQCIFVYSIFFITSAGSNAESICYSMYRYKTFPWDLLHPPKSQANVLFRSHAKFRQKDIRKRRIHKYQYFSSQEVQSNGNKSWRIRNESATNEFPFIRKRQRASTRSKKLPSANQAAAADR